MPYSGPNVANQGLARSSEPKGPNPIQERIILGDEQDDPRGLEHHSRSCLALRNTAVSASWLEVRVAAADVATIAAVAAHPAAIHSRDCRPRRVRSGEEAP